MEYTEFTECTICLSVLTRDNTCSPFVCDHIFHEKCISIWKGACPNCRAFKKRKSLLDFDHPTPIPIPALLGISRVKTCHELFHVQHAFDKHTHILVKCRDCKTNRIYKGLT